MRQFHHINWIVRTFYGLEQNQLEKSFSHLAAIIRSVSHKKGKVSWWLQESCKPWRTRSSFSNPFYFTLSFAVDSRQDNYETTPTAAVGIAGTSLEESQGS
jgi:hypothetical protein